ncbi:inverse autotransporter beta domain-containing protein, partial [Escherichia coli]
IGNLKNYKYTPIVWVNIFVQISLPPALYFSPTIAVAKRKDIHPSKVTKGIHDITTSLGVSESELHKINENHTNNTIYNKENQHVKKITSANISSVFSDTTSASGMVRTLVSSVATDEIKRWLSKHGSVKVSVNVDKNNSLSGTSLDWLTPVYDKNNVTMFTQIGARKKEHRNIINMGGGVRILYDDWMLGINTFYDYDWTGNHSRLGVGAEAWSDYMQLSVNGYHRLSNWHQSKNLDDFNERPANGFDFRTNGWLPGMPQVGGRVIYEQYFGNNVALFGKDNLQHNPYALTVGLTYTPFPLLNFGVDRKFGKSGANDTLFNMNLTYNIGDSWQAQITPKTVIRSRLIEDARYNLVDRNNDIILEYKKQELITLSFGSNNVIKGGPGSQHLISVNVSSKYPLGYIKWNASDFISAGGNITTLDGTNFNIALPKNQPKIINRGQTSYNLEAVAVDIHGNESKSDFLMVIIDTINAEITFRDS